MIVCNDLPVICCPRFKIVGFRLGVRLAPFAASPILTALFLPDA